MTAPAAAGDATQQHPRCFANGCFDLLHLGHLNALRQVKQYPVLPGSSAANHVVAGVHSNEEIRRTKGGAFLNTEVEKERLLLATRFVDEVAHNVPYGVIDRDCVNRGQMEGGAGGTSSECAPCDYVFHGDDAVILKKGKDAGRDMYELCRGGEAKPGDGTFREIRRTEGISTTLMVERLFAGVAADAAYDLANNANDDAEKSKSGEGRSPTVNDSSPTSNKERARQFVDIKPPEDVFVEYVNISAARLAAFYGATSEEVAARTRKQGRRVVFVGPGYWDLFHTGYIELLEGIRARERKKMNVAGASTGTATDDDVFLLLGILDAPVAGLEYFREVVDGKTSPKTETTTLHPPCLQSMMERGIQLLALKSVNDVVFDMRNAVDERFRRAMGVDCVYEIRGHCDFPSGSPRGAQAKTSASDPGTNGGAGTEHETVVLDFADPAVVEEFSGGPGKELMTSAVMKRRFLASRSDFMARRKAKKEPVLVKDEGKGRLT